MFIGENISTLYTELRPDDTVSYALEKVNELHLQQLPIVNAKEYLGLVSEEDLLSAEDATRQVQELRLTFPFVYVFDYQHLYDAMQYLERYAYDVLPVLNSQKEFLGVLTAKELLTAVNSTLSMQQQGAIIVLEMEDRDHSVAHVAHLIESENAKILNTGVRVFENSNRLELTIKVNKNNISSILASLWRHDYIVKSSFNDGSDQNDIQDRYNLLMNYLDL